MNRYLVRIIYVFYACFVFVPNTFGQVYISDKFGYISPNGFIDVPAGIIKGLPLPSHPEGNSEITIRIHSNDSLFKDLHMLLCDEEQKELVFANRGNTCKMIKVNDVGEVSVSAEKSEQLWLLIDNRESWFTSKTISFDLYTITDIDPAMHRELTTSFEQGLEEIRHYFHVPAFDINLLPCGMSNAFSTRDGGHITICTELIFDSIQKSIPYASTGILAHEMGHTFPNLWGSPHFDNELAADNFAAAILFITANFPPLYNEEVETPEPEEIIRQLKRYFESISNLSIETQAAALGGQHPLSIQRINNLNSILIEPKQFVLRWTSEIYPHLTIAGLESILKSPHIGADLELAASLLQKRRACGSVELAKCLIISED